MRLLAILCFLSLAYACNEVPQEFQASEQQPRLYKANELPEETLVPQAALKIEISFVNKKKPLRKGFWIFSHDRLEVEYRLINVSDSTFHIEPAHHAPLGGNPSFAIEGEGRHDSLSPGDLTIVDFTPLKFIKLEPKSVYTGRVDLLSLNTYDFVKGEKYRITATYSSPWGAFRDETGRLRKVWSGTVRSNVLEFSYPN
jgi:hypothetical protein